MSVFTILQCRPSLRMTKTIVRTTTSGGIHVRGYDRAARFRFHPVTFDTLDELDSLLRWATTKPQLCVVRAAPKPNLDLDRWHLRRLKPRDGEPATLNDVVCDWLALDIDQFDSTGHNLPPFTEKPADWAAAVRRLIGLEHAACIWQATSSAGFSSQPRLRLWLLLDAPASNQQLGWWCESMNAAVGYPLLDRAVVRPNQVIYTATPVFQKGIDDPMVERIGRFDGIERAHLHLPTKDPRGRGLLDHVRTDEIGVPVCNVDTAIQAIGGQHGWYRPIVAAAGHAAIFQGADRMNVHALASSMRQRVEETANNDASRLAHYSTEFIAGALRFAQTQQTAREQRINTARNWIGLPPRLFGLQGDNHG
jgi:hypothetical protein